MIKDAYKIQNTKRHLTFTFEVFEKYILSLFVVGAATAIIYLIGRDTLGEGVIALIYLAPISFVAARWGQGPGIAAAVASALAFDFLFIPPFYTFNVGSLEGWLLLVIFLIVAILVVGRIQVGLSQARQREHEAILMYELSKDLAIARDQEAIAQAMGAKLQQYYSAELVQIDFNTGNDLFSASIPPRAPTRIKPELVVPIMAAKDLVGEVRIWEGRIALPSESDRLIRNLINQSALALERAELIKASHDLSSNSRQL